MARFELVDCKPVPGQLAAEIRAIKADTGGTLNSCLRTQRAVNFARSKGCHLSSQAELYDGFAKGLPGFNPANKPGFSTHERRSDGVAYRVPRGLPLFYWQVGMDWDDAHVAAVIRSASKRGWIATITYPGSRSEYHHVNFRKEPRLNTTPVLKRGSKGVRVNRVRRALHYIHSPIDDKPYFASKPQNGPFGSVLEAAVKRFQRDHHQKPDGIVGPQTLAQLRVSYRSAKQHRKAKGKK